MDQFIAEFRQYTDWLPNWMVNLGVLVVAILIGLAIHRLAFRFVQREYPHALPKVRTDRNLDGNGAAVVGAAQHSALQS